MPVDEDSYEIIEKPLPYKINEYVATQRVFNVYISTELAEPHHYIDLFEHFRLAQSTDVFYVYLNTPGGHVTTGAQFIHAMKDCPGRIITVLDGTVCSMGALIFLVADEYIVHDYSQLMFHNFSGGLYGKGHEQIAHLNATTEWYTNMLVEICTPFLDQNEMSNIVNGHDMWMTAEEVRHRLERVVAQAEEDIEHATRLQEEEEEKRVLKRISDRERKLARSKKRETKKQAPSIQ